MGKLFLFNPLEQLLMSGRMGEVQTPVVWLNFLNSLYVSQGVTSSTNDIWSSLSGTGMSFLNEILNFLAFFLDINIFWSVCSGLWHDRSFLCCSQHCSGELRLWSVFFITIQSEDREINTPESMVQTFKCKYYKIPADVQFLCLLMGKGSEELQEWNGPACESQGTSCWIWVKNRK